MEGSTEQKSHRKLHGLHRMTCQGGARLETLQNLKMPYSVGSDTGRRGRAGGKHLLAKLPPIKYNLVPTSQPAAPPYLRGAVLGAGFQHIRGPGRGKRKDNCTCRIQMQITQTCFKPSHKFSSCVEVLETADAGCSWDAAQEWVSLLRVRCSRRRCSSQTPAMHRLRNPVPGMYKINKQTSVQSKEAAQRR